MAAGSATRVCKGMPVRGDAVIVGYGIDAVWTAATKVLCSRRHGSVRPPADWYAPDRHVSDLHHVEAPLQGRAPKVCCQCGRCGQRDCMPMRPGDRSDDDFYHQWVARREGS